MKYLVIWVLVLLRGLQSLLLALAFDKKKLMALEPLCSQRITHQANAFQNSRLWGNLAPGLALLGIIWNNSGGLNGDAKLGNLTQGFTLLSTSAILYFTFGDPVIQNETLQNLDLEGIEKEEVAYSILKYNAVRSKVARLNSGMILMASGLGYTWLTSAATNASQPYKEIVYLSAALFFVQGLMAYLNPGQEEKDMDKIDLMVGATQ